MTDISHRSAPFCTYLAIVLFALLACGALAAQPLEEAGGKGGLSIEDPRAEGFTPTTVRMSWKIEHGIGGPGHEFFRIYRSTEQGDILDDPVAMPVQNVDWGTWPRVLWTATGLEPQNSYCHVLVPVFAEGKTLYEGEPSPPACATTPPADGADWHLLPPKMATFDAFWVRSNVEWRLYAAHRWAVSDATVTSYLGDIPAYHLPVVLPEAVRNVIDGSLGECVGEHVPFPFDWQVQDCLANTIENAIKEVSGRGDSLDPVDRGVLGCVAAEAGGLASGFLFDRPQNLQDLANFLKKEAFRGCISTGVKDALTDPVALTWGEWTQNWLTRTFWDGLVTGALTGSPAQAARAGGVEFVKYALTNPRPPEVPEEWLFWYFWLQHLEAGQIDGLTPAAREALTSVVDWAQAEQCGCLPSPAMTASQVAGLTSYLVEPQTRPVNAVNPDFLLTGTLAFPPSSGTLRPVYEGWQSWLASNDPVAYNFYLGSPGHNRHAGYYSWLFSGATGETSWHRCWTTAPSFEYVTCGDGAPAAPQLELLRFAGPDRLELEWTDRSEDETGFRLYLERTGFGSEIVEFDSVPGSGDRVAAVLTVQRGFDYCARVGAWNGAGLSPLSAELCADSGGSPAVPPPAHLTATPLTNHSIRLDWAAVPNADRYTVYEEGTLSPLLRLTEQTSVVIEGLEAGRRSCFDVYAWLWPSHSSTASTACATTFSGPPKAPASLRVEAMGRSVAVLSWTDRSENERYWPIEIREHGTVVDERTFAGTEGTGRRIAVVEGLSAGTDYSFRVRALGADGQRSAWTPSAYGSTHDRAPEPVRMDGMLAGDGRVHLIWEGGEGADYFHVFRTFDQGQNHELRPDQFELEVEAEIASCWKVRAVNNEGYTEDEHCVNGLLLPPALVWAETIEKTQIRFAWESVPGVDGYELWDLSNERLAVLEGDDSTSFTFERALGKRLCLVVYSFLDGHLSGASDVTCGYSEPRQPEIAELGWLDLERTYLRWAPAESWEWIDIVGWDRESGQDEVAGSAAPGSVEWQFFRPTSASGGMCYQLRRRSPAGAGAWSEALCQWAYPQPAPAQPVVVPAGCDPWAGGHSCQKLLVSWSDEIEGEDRFEIEISGEQDVIVGPDTTSVFLEDLAPGYGYSVRVRARHGLDVATPFSPAGVGATSMPVALWETMRPADWWLHLDWLHPFEGHWAVAGYEIWQILSGAPNRHIATTQATEAEVHLSELVGDEYCLAIKTLGQAADSFFSSTRCISPPSPIVATPVACSGPDCESMRLTWTHDGKETEGFVLKAWADPPFGASGWIDWPGVVPAGTTELTWTGLVDGWSYCFFVAALEAGGQTPFSEEGPRSCATAGDPPPDLLVLEPKGGEQWRRGETVQIRWQSAIADAEVLVRTLRGEDTWRTIDPQASNEGLLEWSLPDDGEQWPAAADYRVEICGTTSGLCGRSDHAFEIQAPLPGPPPPLRVSSPNGGEVWQVLHEREITWQQNDAISAVTIDLFDDGVFKRRLAAGTGNDGSWTWPILNHVPSCGYQVRICDVQSQGFCDWSDGDFALVAAGAPDEPADVRAEPGPGAGRVTVRWRDFSHNEEIFEVRMTDGGPSEIRQVNGTCGEGAPMWTSYTATPGTGLCFQVRSRNQDGTSAWLPAEPVCTAAGSLPAAPAGVEAVGGPGLVELAFEDRSSDEDGFHVEVWSSEGTTLYETVTLAANEERHRVEPLGTGAGRCFRVRSFNGSGTSSWSPPTSTAACAFASAQPPLQVTAPSGGDTLRLGEPFRIDWRWASGVSSEPVRVELVRGGSRLIADGVEGGYTWTVDNFSWPPGANDFRIRVTGVDSGRSATSGEFTIKHRVPEPPGDVVAVGGPGRVRVRWRDQSQEEHGFRIKVFSGHGVELGVEQARPSLGTGAQRHYDLDGLAMGTERCVQMQAYNSAESEWVPANLTLACDVSSSLEISSPSAGVTWRVGEQRTISWQRSNFTGHIELALFAASGDLSKPPIGVIASPVAGNAYTWTVENFGTQLSGSYKIVARSVEVPDFYAESGAFTLREHMPTAPVISSIDGGPHQVTLRFEDRAGNEYGYRVRVLTGDGNEDGVYELPAVPGTGSIASFTSTVSGHAVERCFQVQAFNTEVGAWVPSSPLHACGTSAALSVAQPAAGTTWKIGRIRTIEWTRSQFPGDVDLELWRLGTRLGIVASGVGGSSYTWTVDAFGLQVGHDDYRIRVASSAEPSFYADSADFILREQAPSPPVWVDVSGGVGSVSFSFRDESTNEYNFQVKFYEGDGNYLGAATLDPVAGTGTVITHTISGLGQGEERCFKVRARNTSNSAWSPSSAFDACASSAKVTLTEPTGGETYRTGELRTLAWNRLSFEGQVKLELLKGGAFVQEIGRTSADSLTWTVERYGQPWGHDYTVRVTGVGAPAVSDESGTLTLRDQPPAPPSHVAATGGDGLIDISWQDNANNETSYEMKVYNGLGTFLQTVPLNANSTGTRLSGLGEDIQRCFQVRARNSDTSSWVPASAQAVCATTDPPPSSPPERPQNVTVEGNIGQFHISWHHSQADTDGFRIKMHDAHGSQLATVDIPLASSHNWGGISSGTTRCFQVQAFNEHGYSALEPSSATGACATTASPPSRPSWLNATGGPDRVRAEWQNVTGETGYELRVYDAGGNLQQTHNLGANDTDHEVAVGDNVTRCFRVRAVNAAGASDWRPMLSQSPVCGTSDPPVGSPPARPSHVRASGGNGTLLVEWNHGFTNTTGFHVEIYDGGGYQETRSLGLAHSLSISVGSATTRCFRVEAFNGDGGSGYEPSSTTAVCATSATVPRTVTLHQPSGGEIWHQGHTYTISWSRGGGVQHVAVFLYRNGSYLQEITPGNNCTGVDASSLSWTIPTSLADDADYQIKVEEAAPHSCDGQASDISGHFRICTPATCPQ